MYLSLNTMVYLKSPHIHTIMNIMSMAIKTGEEVTIEATGSDEEAAIASITKVMEDNKLV